MTHPDASERAREVAAGLTKAQQRAVIRGEGGSVSVRAVLRHQPSLFGRGDWGAGYGWLQFPTPLCLEVRRILEADNPARP